MIKSITFSNMYSFKHDTVVDFQVYKNTGNVDSVYQFVKKNVSTSIKISNFALIYGKNNSGKTNLLKSINDIFYFINNNSKSKFTFTRFETTQLDSIDVEIELVSSNNIYRYGFIIDSKDSVSSEWLYMNKDKSKAESLVLERDKNNEKDVVKLASFLSKFKSITEPSNEKKLIIPMLKDFNISELDPFFNILGSIHSVFSIEENIEENLPVDQLDDYCINDDLQQKLNDTLRTFDTNIEKLTIKRMGNEYFENYAKFKNIFAEGRKQELPSGEILKKIYEEVGEDFILEQTRQAIFVKPDTGIDEKIGYSFSASFVDSEINNSYYIHYRDLSFGTRKLIVLLLNIMLAKDGSVFLIDEIEHGFHKVALLKILDLLHSTISGRRIQIISTTHEEDLLDLSYISDESKIIVNNNDNSSIDYVSYFKLRKGIKLSKRYLIGALRGVPRIKGNL